MLGRASRGRLFLDIIPVALVCTVVTVRIDRGYRERGISLRGNYVIHAINELRENASAT